MVMITWNVVCRNFHGTESLLRHLREKITDLEENLQGYPPDSVHLLVQLTRDLKKDTYTASLALRLPDKIEQSERSGKDEKRAFDDALRALLSQLKPQEAAKSGQEKTRFSDKPMAAGTGPQNSDELAHHQHEVHA